MAQDIILEQLEKLINIDSPSGYHYHIQDYLEYYFKKLGFETKSLRKGGIRVNLGGEGKPIMLMAHVDTLGCCVGYIKENGRLSISNMTTNPNNIETETVRVITRHKQVYEGTIQLVNASVHVNKDVNEKREFDNLEVVLDEDVASKKEVEELGILAGDFIALSPRYMVTTKKYIKSRFLDDKASAAVLMAFAKQVKESDEPLPRNVWLNFTMFEEIGHGAAAGIPEEIEDVISVDMGCVGEHIDCTEKKVSICAKDSSGPYHFKLTNELIETAEKSNLNYSVDVYPRYSSDAQLAIKTGHDLRHALIGPGVYASHGYERTHVEGLLNTYQLIHDFIYHS